MKISVGNSRTSRAWKIKEMSWEDFIQRCSETIRTAETVQEYRKLPKGQQDNIKDVGGFVGGELRNGIRKKDTVVNRCMLTLDADYADDDFWEQLELFFDFRCLIYSTHKHTPERPRLRLIIPLSRPVTADEYTAIARRIAADIGIEQFDDTTYQPHRLMYWASTSADGEFVFRHRDGNPVDADAVLARYKDWHDTSEYPVSSRQKKIVSHALKKQADPLTKDGIVGAFCRAYPIQEAISAFLSDVYAPSSLNGRYDYIPADSIAGVIVYNDKFAYSHHATDPACGKLCNAFDLVRIHKFAYLDKDETDSEKSPSFKAMLDFAMNDDNVKAQTLTDKETAAQEEFLAISDDDDVMWRHRLSMNKRGDIENTIQNLTIILQNDPKLKGIVFNELSDCIEIKGSVPWQHPSKYWRDADDAQLLTYLTYHYGKFTRVNYDVALAKVVDDRSFHPIRQYLDGLHEWDRTERVDTLLTDYLGAEDNPYTRAVIRKTLCGAIARVMVPGIKFDTMLVLSGPQGIGKSTIMDVTENITSTLRAQANHPPCIMEAAGFCPEQSAKTRGIGYEEENSPTLRAGVTPAAVIYDARGNGNGDVSSTVTGDHENRVTDYTSVVVENPKSFDVRFTSEGTRNARQNVYETEISRTIDTGGNAPDSNQGGVAVVAYGICSKDSNSMKSDNPKSGIYEAETARTLDTSNQCPAKNQGGIAVVEGNGARPSHHGDGYKESDIMYTLNTVEQHAVAYGIDRATYNMGQNAQFGIAVEEEVEPTMVAKGPGAVAHPVYHSSKNSFHTNFKDTAASDTLVATDYKDPPTVSKEPYYIVRRLTPTECARLQGMPSWWCDGLETENPDDEELAFWRKVYDDYACINGTKPKSDKQIIKWLKAPYSDSAAYKLYGNGITLSVVFFVLAGIAYWDNEP